VGVPRARDIAGTPVAGKRRYVPGTLIVSVGKLDHKNGEGGTGHGRDRARPLRGAQQDASGNTYYECVGNQHVFPTQILSFHVAGWRC
jgi:hypothetical protein